jgi:5'-methylthioadenosine phosphorylase
MTSVEVAIIGGSGLYKMAGLDDVESRQISTPFGDPSDEIVLGTLHGRRVAFLPRHGRGHVLMPSEVPYRANIFALKTLGVKYLVSISACGSLREAYAPGHVVIPDQLFDFTRERPRTFFGHGLVAHVSTANPFSAELSRALAGAVGAAGGTVHEGGSFITIEGPRFSTIAESNTYRQWGMDVIGMTTSPEAFLALEAEMAYSVMAHVTDYDVWHESEEPVTVDMVVQTLRHNAALAQRAVSHLVEHMEAWQGDYPAHHALRDAIITDRQHVARGIKEELAPLVAKYLS